MAFEDSVERRIIRTLDDPLLDLKIYDTVGVNSSVSSLCYHVKARKENQKAFAGVARIYTHQEFGSSANIILYGREAELYKKLGMPEWLDNWAL